MFGGHKRTFSWDWLLLTLPRALFFRLQGKPGIPATGTIVAVRWSGYGLINRVVQFGTNLDGSTLQELESQQQDPECVYSYRMELTLKIPSVSVDRNCLCRTDSGLKRHQLEAFLIKYGSGNTEVPVFIGPEYIEFDYSCLS
jgi:hypothetical protein